MELNFLLSAQEAVISRFKLNKRFVEKELSSLFNQAKKMKKTCKDKPEATVSNIEALQAELRRVKVQYGQMISVEDHLIFKLEQRLGYLKKVSKNLRDPGVLTEYFESRVHRGVLDYLLQNQLFQSASTFAKEARLEVFSDLQLFKEVHSILNKFN